jgi:dihydrofolate synthase/folylpolyglutamate synthase
LTPRQALLAIDELDKFGIILGLDRIGACLRAMGDPQRRYPCIHVGGTNGKGSTCAFTSKVLEEAGFNVGLYTSPALETFGERMRVNSLPLPDEAVPQLYQNVLDAMEREPAARGMTQFEVITAMAFDHFARSEVDIAVIEVGLGGRLDSTNVLAPAAIAITNISLEHSEHLGSTVEEIAVEKAGIARAGVPFVTSATGGGLIALKAEAKAAGAPVCANNEDFSVQCAGGECSFSGQELALEGLTPGLPGIFQQTNMATALALIEQLRMQGWDIPDQAIKRGVAAAKWPGRLELFGDGPRILLDGAHNPHAAQALAKALENDFERARLILVLGILDDKDGESIVQYLAPLADEVILTSSASNRAQNPIDLRARAPDLLATARVIPNLSDALKNSVELANPDDLILATGSLTLVGEARRWLRGEGYLG